ncbi:hypothetical protein [Massilia aquatica]|uniref:Transmembrane protein n=1 Tax=Massilia aquatica TaxID=2609000 RepID=A0ABX0M1A8_9BURK|nr:hypothetical protein [Massilia aquatica]NHZ38875.1 hypothetical protein [Massilia aquatica]
MKYHSTKTMGLYSLIISTGAASTAMAIFKISTGQYRVGICMGLLSLGLLCGYWSACLFERYKREDEELLARNKVDNISPSTEKIVHKPEIFTPAYLDTSHPRYSAKLAAAVKAWEAMEDENLRRGKMPMAAMAAWLEKNSSALGLTHKRASEQHKYQVGDINKTAIAEVSKICNWEVDGGPPPSLGG